MCLKLTIDTQEVKTYFGCLLVKVTLMHYTETTDTQSIKSMHVLVLRGQTAYFSFHIKRKISSLAMRDYVCRTHSLAWPDCNHASQLCMIACS